MLHKFGLLNSSKPGKSVVHSSLIRLYSNSLINCNQCQPLRKIAETLSGFSAKIPQQRNHKNYLCQLYSFLSTGTSSTPWMLSSETNNCNGKLPYRSHTSCGWYTTKDRYHFTISREALNSRPLRQSSTDEHSNQDKSKDISEEKVSWHANPNHSIKTPSMFSKTNQLDAVPDNILPHYAKTTIAFERLLIERRKQMSSCEPSAVSASNTKYSQPYYKRRNSKSTIRTRKSILTNCQNIRPSIQTAQEDITRLISRCYTPRKHRTLKDSTVNKPKVSKTFRLSSGSINPQHRDSAIQVSNSPSATCMETTKVATTSSILAVAHKVVQTIDIFPPNTTSFDHRSESLSMADSSSWGGNRSTQNAKTEGSSDVSFTTSHHDRGVGVCSLEVLEPSFQNLTHYPQETSRPTKRAPQTTDPILDWCQSDSINRSESLLWDASRYKMGSFLVDGAISSGCDTGGTVSSSWETLPSIIKLTHASSGFEINYFHTNSEVRRGSEIFDNQPAGRFHLRDDDSIDHLGTCDQFNKRCTIHNERLCVPGNIRSTFSSLNIVMERMVDCGLPLDSPTSLLSPSLTTYGNTSDIVLDDSTRSESCSLRVDGENNRGVMEFFSTRLSFSKVNLPSPSSAGVLAFSQDFVNGHPPLKRQLQGTVTIANWRQLNNPLDELQCSGENLKTESATLSCLSASDYNAIGVLIPLGETTKQIVLKLWASAYQSCIYLENRYCGLQLMTLCLRLSSTISQCGSLELPCTVFCRLLTEYVRERCANGIVLDVVSVRVDTKNARTPTSISAFSTVKQSHGFPELIKDLYMAVIPVNLPDEVHSIGLETFPCYDLDRDFPENNPSESAKIILAVRQGHIFTLLRNERLKSNTAEVCKQYFYPQKHTLNLCLPKEYSKRGNSHKTLTLLCNKVHSRRSNSEAMMSSISTSNKTERTSCHDGEVYFRRVVLGSRSLENHFQFAKASYEKRMRLFKPIINGKILYITQFMTYAHQSTTLLYNDQIRLEKEILQVNSFEENIVFRQLNNIPQETEILEVAELNGPLVSEQILKVKEKILFGALIMECLSQVELQEFWEPRVGNVQPCANRFGIPIYADTNKRTAEKSQLKYGGGLLSNCKVSYKYCPPRISPTLADVHTGDKDDRVELSVDQDVVQYQKVKKYLCFRNLVPNELQTPARFMQRTKNVVIPDKSTLRESGSRKDETWTGIDESKTLSEWNCQSTWTDVRASETLGCLANLSGEASESTDNRSIGVVDLHLQLSDMLSDCTYQEDSFALLETKEVDSLSSGQLGEAGESVQKYIWSPNSQSPSVINQHVLCGCKDKDGHQSYWETLATMDESKAMVTQFLPLQIRYSPALLQNIEKVSTASSCSEYEIFFNDESTCTTLHKSCIQNFASSPIKADSVDSSQHTPTRSISDADAGNSSVDREPTPVPGFTTVSGDNTEAYTMTSSGYFQYLATIMGFVVRAWQTPLRADRTDERLKAFTRRLRTIFLLTGPTKSLCGVLDILLKNGIFVMLTDNLHHSQRILFHKMTRSIKVKLLPKLNSYLSSKSTCASLTTEEHSNELKDELAALYTVFLFSNSMKSSQLLVHNAGQMEGGKSQGNPEDCVQAVNQWWHSFWWAHSPTKKDQMGLNDETSLYSHVMDALFPARKTIHLQGSGILRKNERGNVVNRWTNGPVGKTVTIENASRSNDTPSFCRQSKLMLHKGTDMGTQTRFAPNGQFCIGQEELQSDININNSSKANLNENSADSHSFQDIPYTNSVNIRKTVILTLGICRQGSLINGYSQLRFTLCKSERWTKQKSIHKTICNATSISAQHISSMLFPYSEQPSIILVASASLSRQFFLQKFIPNFSFQLQTSHVNAEPEERSDRENERVYQTNCSNTECHDFQLLPSGETNISLVKKQKYFLTPSYSPSVNGSAYHTRTRLMKDCLSLNGRHCSEEHVSYLGQTNDRYIEKVCEKSHRGNQNYLRRMRFDRSSLQFTNRGCNRDCQVVVPQLSTHSNERSFQHILSTQSIRPTIKTCILSPFATILRNRQCHNNEFLVSQNNWDGGPCVVRDTAMHNSKKVLKMNVKADADSSLSSVQSSNARTMSLENVKASSSMNELDRRDSIKTKTSTSCSVASSNDTSHPSQKRTVYDSTYASRRRSPAKRVLVESTEETEDLEESQKYSIRPPFHDTFCKKEHPCCTFGRPSRVSESDKQTPKAPCRCKPIMKKSRYRTWASRSSRAICTCALIDDDSNELGILPISKPLEPDKDSPLVPSEDKEARGHSQTGDDIHSLEPLPEPQTEQTCFEDTDLLLDVPENIQSVEDVGSLEPLLEPKMEQACAVMQNCTCDVRKRKAKRLRCCNCRTASAFDFPWDLSLTANIKLSHNRHTSGKKRKCECYKDDVKIKEDQYKFDNRIKSVPSTVASVHGNDEYQPLESPIRQSAVNSPVGESDFHVINRQHHNTFQIRHIDSIESSSQQDRKGLFYDRADNISKSNEPDCSFNDPVRALLCYPEVKAVPDFRGSSGIVFRNHRSKGRKLCICSHSPGTAEGCTDQNAAAMMTHSCKTENSEERVGALLHRRYSASKRTAGAHHVTCGCCDKSNQPGSPIIHGRALWFNEPQPALVKSYSWTADLSTKTSTGNSTGFKSPPNDSSFRRMLMGNLLSSKVAAEKVVRISPECVSGRMSMSCTSLAKEQGYSPLGFSTDHRQEDSTKRLCTRIVKLRRSSASLSNNTIGRTGRSILRDSSQSLSQSSRTSESNVKTLNCEGYKETLDTENKKAHRYLSAIKRSIISRSPTTEVNTVTQTNVGELTSSAINLTPLGGSGKKPDTSSVYKTVLKRQVSSRSSSSVQSQSITSYNDVPGESPSQKESVQERKRWCVSNTSVQTDLLGKPTTTEAMLIKRKTSKGTIDEVVKHAEVELPTSRHAYKFVKTYSEERRHVEANCQSPSQLSTMNKVTMTSISRNVASVYQPGAAEQGLTTTGQTLSCFSHLNKVNSLPSETQECDETRAASKIFRKTVSSTTISSTSEVSISDDRLKVNQTFRQNLERSSTDQLPTTYVQPLAGEPLSPTACTSPSNALKPKIHGQTSIREKIQLNADKTSVNSTQKMTFDSVALKRSDSRNSTSVGEYNVEKRSMTTSLLETQSGRRTPTPGGYCPEVKQLIIRKKSSERINNLIQPNSSPPTGCSSPPVTESIRFDQTRVCRQNQPDCNVGIERVELDRNYIRRNSTSVKEQVTKTMRRSSSIILSNSTEINEYSGVKETKKADEEHASWSGKHSACDCCKCGRSDWPQGCNYTVTHQTSQQDTSERRTSKIANDQCVKELLIRFRPDTCSCQRSISSGNRMFESPTHCETLFPGSSPVGFKYSRKSPSKQNVSLRQQAPPLQPTIIPARSFQSLESDAELLNFTRITEESSVAVRVNTDETSINILASYEKSHETRVERMMTPSFPLGRPSLWPSSSSRLCATYSSITLTTTSSDSVFSSIDDSKIYSQTMKESIIHVPSVEAISTPNTCMDECNCELNALKDVLNARKRGCPSAFCSCSSRMWQPYIPDDHCEMYRRRRRHPCHTPRKSRRKGKKYSTSASRTRAELAKQLTNCPVSTADSRKLDEELASELSASTLACLRKYLLENGLTHREDCKNIYSPPENMDAVISSKMTPIRMAALNCWVFPGGGVRHVVPCTCHERAMADIARGIYPDYPPERSRRSRVFSTSKHRELSSHSSLGHHGSSTLVNQTLQNVNSDFRLKQESPVCCKDCPAMKRKKDLVD